MKFQFLNWLELPIKNEVGDTSGIGYFKSMDEELNFPIEIYVDNKDSLKEDSIYDLDVIFYCHGINKIAKDREEFLKLNEPLNYEAQIPTGAFPLDDSDKDFTPSPISLMNVTVTNIVSYFRVSDLLYACSGVEDVISYTLNGDTESVTIADTDYPVVGEVTIAT